MDMNSREIEYYHKAIDLSDNVTPLANMTIVFSLYSGSERDFLSHLVKILGGTVEEDYRRNDKPLLVCPEAREAKYAAAILWSMLLFT